jgi:arylsulfatase A-like enzyme
VIEPGLVREDLVSEIDIMPTILAAVGITPVAGLPGQSLLPLLRGGSPTGRQYLFTEMNFQEPDTFRPQRTVRDDRNKLVVNLSPERDQSPAELFDLQGDPEEAENLLHKTALSDARRRLEPALRQWRQETGDPLLDPVRRAHWRAAAAHWQSVKNTKAKGEPLKVLPSEILTRLK